MSIGGLCELYEELDGTVKEYSEVLIQELALRDELEYEKELKNQFISLLLSIQRKRRELHGDKKRTGGGGAIAKSPVGASADTVRSDC